MCLRLKAAQQHLHHLQRRRRFQKQHRTLILLLLLLPIRWRGWDCYSNYKSHRQWQWHGHWHHQQRWAIITFTLLCGIIFLLRQWERYFARCCCCYFYYHSTATAMVSREVLHCSYYFRQSFLLLATATATATAMLSREVLHCSYYFRQSFLLLATATAATVTAMLSREVLHCSYYFRQSFLLLFCWMRSFFVWRGCFSTGQRESKWLAGKRTDW